MFAKLCGKGADGGEDFEAFGRGIGEGFGEPLATGPVFEIGDEGEGAVEGVGAFVEGRFFFPDDAEGAVPGHGGGAAALTIFFAGMVLPVTEFILDVLSHNETKSQQQQQ